MPPFMWFLIALLAGQGQPLPVRSVTVSGLTIAFSTTPLDSVSRAVPAEVRLRGDAGDAVRWICLRLAGSPRMVLLLESSELDGAAIGGMDLHPEGRTPEFEGSCRPFSAIPANVVTDRGVRVGLLRDSVVHLLGRPQRDSAGVSTYDASAPFVDGSRGRTQLVQYSTLRIGFAADRVAYFWADYRVIN